MTLFECGEIHAHGIQIGSHTVNHPELYKLNPIRWNTSVAIQGNHRERTGRSDSILCLSIRVSRGWTRSSLRTCANCSRRNAMKTACAQSSGTTARPDDDWFFMPRLPVNSFDDLRQPRNRRARKDPCRQSCACHQDPVIGDRQRGLRAFRRPVRSQGPGAGRRDARSGRPPSRARTYRRASHHHRHRHRGCARDRGAAPNHGEDSIAIAA